MGMDEYCLVIVDNGITVSAKGNLGDSSVVVGFGIL